MSRADQRARRLRRIAVAWLLTVGLTGVLGVAAAEAASREHSCCPSAPARAEAPPTPCPSLLPLSCCDAATLPAPAHGASDPGLALGVGTALAALGLAEPPLLLRDAPDPSPRVSPLELSVVLRL